MWSWGCVVADEGDTPGLGGEPVCQESLVVFLRGVATGAAGYDSHLHGPADHRRHCQPQGEQTPSQYYFNNSINQSINARFVGRRYTTRPGAPAIVS